jgi:4-diphosphocytidyl-2-C-methyl-D-erythritol kinase
MPRSALYDVLAPAKLNLFLHVLGQRPDGYHLIESVFMLIDWCDTLHFEIRADGEISRSDLLSGSAVALPTDDLTVRAARLLQKATGCKLGVHITLEKRIPSQAGMGGGSSDAASCLMALQRLWQVELPVPELHALALRLGADVPFFLSGRNAWVEGVGEKIRPIDLPAGRFLVLKPFAGVSTPDIFGSPALKRDTPPATILGFAENARLNADAAFNFGHNDLTPVAINLCPEIGQALDWLALRGLKGKMTGSGSAIFAHLPSPADEAADKLLLGKPGTDWRMRICSNLQSHPMWPQS